MLHYQSHTVTNQPEANLMHYSCGMHNVHMITQTSGHPYSQLQVRTPKFGYDTAMHTGILYITLGSFFNIVCLVVPLLSLLLV